MLVRLLSGSIEFHVCSTNEDDSYSVRSSMFVEESNAHDSNSVQELDVCRRANRQDAPSCWTR